MIKLGDYVAYKEGCGPTPNPYTYGIVVQPTNPAYDIDKPSNYWRSYDEMGYQHLWVKFHSEVGPSYWPGNKPTYTIRVTYSEIRKISLVELVIMRMEGKV